MNLSRLLLVSLLICPSLQADNLPPVDENVQALRVLEQQLGAGRLADAERQLQGLQQRIPGDTRLQGARRQQGRHPGVVTHLAHLDLQAAVELHQIGGHAIEQLTQRLVVLLIQHGQGNLVKRLAQVNMLRFTTRRFGRSRCGCTGLFGSQCLRLCGAGLLGLAQGL